MKIIFIVKASLFIKRFLLFSAFAFINTMSFGQETFKKQYTLTGGLYNYGSVMLYNSQVTIIKGASYFKKADNHYIYTHLLDSNGKVIKTKLYGPDSNVKADFASNKMMLTNNNYLVFFTSDGYIFKSSVNGDVIWSKQLISKKYTRWNYKVIAEANDGNYLLAGNVSDDDSDIVQLLKINRNTGNVIWYKTFVMDFSYLSSWYPENITVTKNGGIYFEGANSCGLCESSTPEYMVLDNEGKLKYFKRIDAYPGSFGQSLYAKKLFAKNNRVYMYCTINEFDQILLEISDPATLRYGTTILDESIFATQKYLLAHKYLLPVQTDDYTVFRSNGAILKYETYNNNTLMQYDQYGRICNNYTVPRVDTTTTQQLFEFNQKQFLYGKDSLYTKDISVFSYDASSTTNILCEGNAPETLFNLGNNITVAKPQLSITLYPNPTINTLTIAGLNNKNKTTLQIINTNGSVLKEVTTTSSTQTINVHSLAAGAYLLRINNEEEIITKTFIKQ